MKMRNMAAAIFAIAIILATSCQSDNEEDPPDTVDPRFGTYVYQETHLWDSDIDTIMVLNNVGDIVITEDVLYIFEDTSFVLNTKTWYEWYLPEMEVHYVSYGVDTAFQVQTWLKQ